MPSSTHPPATFKGFIYGEFLRYARNTSEKDEFDKTCNRYKSNLLKRGYEEDFVLDIQQSVSHSDRQHILETTGNKNKKIRKIFLYSSQPNTQEELQDTSPLKTSKQLL